MAENDGRRVPPDEEVVYLDEDGGAEDVASALEAAEKAVAAVEQRHHRTTSGVPRQASEEARDESGDGADAGAADGRLAEERERALKAEEEAGRLREALLRKAADFENLKRRAEREKGDYTRFALTEVMRDLLAVLDNLERALAHAPAAGPDDLRTGVEMTARQLAEVLRRYGVTEVPALGTPFDPQFHEAMMREEAAGVPSGTVLEVFQKGYVLNDRLLRPARVKVSAAPSAPAAEA